MVRVFKELDSLTCFDIPSVVVGEFDKEITIVGVVIARPMLIREIVTTQQWDWFIC